MNGILAISIIVLIAVSLSTYTIVPAFAEGKRSFFQKVEDFLNEPFLSLEKAAGGDGHIRQHITTSEQPLKPFMSSWICQILVGDFSNFLGFNDQYSSNMINMCKS